MIESGSGEKRERQLSARTVNERRLRDTEQMEKVALSAEVARKILESREKKEDMSEVAGADKPDISLFVLFALF